MLYEVPSTMYQVQCTKYQVRYSFLLQSALGDQRSTLEKVSSN